MKLSGKKATRFRVQLGLDVKRCSTCRVFTRPCEIYGEPAIFHRWCEVETGIISFNMVFRPRDQDRLRREFDETHNVPAGCTLEKLKDVVALVEWDDGTVSKVNPDSVKFLDVQQPYSHKEAKETKT